MLLPLGAVFNQIDVFLLVFIRMTGLFVIAPIFGRRNIPVYFKIGFSFFLALMLVNTVTVPDMSKYTDIFQFAFLVFKEFITGVTIGYVCYLVFTAIYVAGQLIDMQIGFGMVNVIDPLSNIQVPITSNFYSILAMLIFLTVNGHHVLIRAIYNSYTSIPLGGALFSKNLMNDVLNVFGNIFVIGFKIAAPITAAILISDIALGVISKTIPQINVFVVGMPLKIILGIVVMIVTIPMFIMLLEMLFNDMNSEMLNFIRDLGSK